MSNAGWGVLIVLVLLLCTYSDTLFFLLLGVLMLWMWSEYKRTGEQPDLARMVNRLFSGGKRRGGRGRYPR